MDIIELTLVLLLIIAVAAAFLRRTPIGLPAFLVVVGALASLLPGLDDVQVDPEVFLLLFIPPLLFADARLLPRRDLLQVLQPVLLLALGLVVLSLSWVWVSAHVRFRLHWGWAGSKSRARVEIARAGIAAVQPVLHTLADPNRRRFVEELIQRYEGKIVLREAELHVAASKAERIG